MIFLANTPLHGRPLRYSVNPLLQMRERFHVILGKARELPTLDPWPGADIRNRIFTFTFTSEILARRASILAAQLDLEYTVDAEGFVLEAVDGIWVPLAKSPTQGIQKTTGTYRGSSPSQIC